LIVILSGAKDLRLLLLNHHLPVEWTSRLLIGFLAILQITVDACTKRSREFIRSCPLKMNHILEPRDDSRKCVSIRIEFNRLRSISLVFHHGFTIASRDLLEQLDLGPALAAGMPEIILSLQVNPKRRAGSKGIGET
jgi:hypothetical protein